jgi:hypothetical protein
MAAAAVLVAAVGASSIVIGVGDQARKVTALGDRSFPTTLDGHRDWMLALFNGEIQPTDSELEQRFTPEFLQAVSPNQVRNYAESLKARKPWRVLREVERRESRVLAAQLVSTSGEQARLTLQREPGGRLSASTILVATPCAQPVDPATVSLPEPIAGQFAWFFALINRQDDVTDDEINGHLALAFLAEFPPDRFRLALGQIRGIGPFTLRSYEGAPLSTGVIARLGVRTGEEARFTLAVDPTSPGRITGAQVMTLQPCRLPE